MQSERLHGANKPLYIEDALEVSGDAECRARAEGKAER